MFENAKPCPELVWFATEDCNLQCVYCCAAGGNSKDSNLLSVIDLPVRGKRSSPVRRNNKNGNILSTAEAKELIRQAAGFTRFFVIIGGEPLLRKDLPGLLDYAGSLGLSCSIITKGTLITGKWAEEMARRQIAVNIALDSLSPAICDRLSGVEGTCEKTLAAIETCRKAGILQGITATLTQLNAAETLKLTDFAKETGVEGCWMPLRPLGRGMDTYRRLALTGQAYEEYLHHFYYRAKEINKATSLNFYLYDPIYCRVLHQHGDYGNKAVLENYPLEKKLCGFGRYLNVGARGNVLACLFTGLVVGNVREKSLAEIWAQTISLPFFKAIHNPENLRGACGRCKYNRICGGCRTRAYQLTGDWFAADPACYFAIK